MGQETEERLAGSGDQVCTDCESRARRNLLKVKEGNALIRKARDDALKFILAIGPMLDAVIAEYFVENDAKKSLLQSILPSLNTYQKIQIFANMETDRGVQFRVQYRRLVKQLEELNTYRNTLAHGFPLSLPKGVTLWKVNRQGRTRPIQMNKRFVQQMENKFDKSLDGLSRIYERLLAHARKVRMSKTD